MTGILTILGVSGAAALAMTIAIRFCDLLICLAGKRQLVPWAKASYQFIPTAGYSPGKWGFNLRLKQHLSF
jgi:phage terminase large subunit GpA-like protein